MIFRVLLLLMLFASSAFAGAIMESDPTVDGKIDTHELTNDHPEATTAAKGLMPAADKIKLAAIFNILNYGAVCDGTTDDTAAFVSAIAAADDVCGTVTVPSTATGCKIDTGNITVARCVSVSGDKPGQWNAAPYFTGTDMADLAMGPTLLITGTINPVFIMESGSRLANLNVVYPNQTATNPPVTYPYFVQGKAGIPANQSDVMIEDLFLYNVFNFSYFAENHWRVIHRNIWGNVLNRGIYLDNSLDVDRIENIHFWPFFNQGKTITEANDLHDYQTNNSIGIEINRADSIQGHNIFMYAVGIGIVFDDPDGLGGYGQFTNISMDSCPVGIRGVLSNTSVKAGYEITNYSYAMDPTFQAAHGVANSYAIDINGPGNWMFSNVSVWGGPNKFMDIAAGFNAGLVKITNANIMHGIVDAELINNAGTGLVIISDMYSPLSKTAATGGATSSIYLDSPRLVNETCTTLTCYFSGIQHPTTTVDNTIPRWDGVTGKILQGSTVAISDTNVLTASGIAVGTDAPSSLFHVVSEITGTARGFTQSQHNNGEHAPVVFFKKSRGTAASPLVVGATDELMNFSAYGYDGSSYLQRVAIGAKVTGSVSAGVIPTKLFFQTGSSSLGTRMSIDSEGLVGINTVDLDGTPATGQLTIKGTTNDGSTNIFVGRDSDEANVFNIDTNGNILMSGMIKNTPQAATCTENGSPSTLTITPTSSYVEITNADAEGCNITMGETGMTAGTAVTLCVVSNAGGVVTFADTAGVTQLAGAFAADIDDCITLRYGNTTTWREVSRSVN